MSIGWKTYRIVCILQIIVTSFLTFRSLVGCFINFSFSPVVRTITFMLMASLALFAITLLNKNYPETPVTGRQKTSFNQLFLVNFLLLAFLFGFVISEYRELMSVIPWIERSNLNISNIAFYFIIITLSLIFQLIILYGLFELRGLLYSNFRKKKFEFEEKT